MAVTKDEGDIIQRSMGVFGKWHFWVCIVIFLVKFPVAWHQLNIVIVAPTTNFDCSNETIDKCSSDCPSHVFDRRIFTETIITQWDLVCEDAYLTNIAQTMTMLGILVGNVLFGFWSDRAGRRMPMVIAVIIQVVTGTASAFVPWFWFYCVLRFVVAVATGGTMITSFVLVMELVGTKWRTTVATLYQIPFNLGHLLLAVFGYWIRDWRYFQLAISIPSVVLISYYWILPESPRWLLAVGKTEKAIKILEKAAYHNKLPTAGIEEDVKSYAEKKRNEPKAGGNIVDLFRTSNMRIKTLAICFNWAVTGLCFFGVSQYIGLLQVGDMFVNIAISAAIQVPGTLISIVALEKLGRKKTLILSNLLGGIPMLLIPAFPVNHFATPYMAVVGMLGLSIVFPTVYIYSGELFPTVVRNVGVGTSSMCARIGSIIAPYISTLNLYTAAWVSPVIFGILPILSAVVSFWLPETLNCKLPDTIEEAESLTREKKVPVQKETETETSK
ncbi:PREDICTED: organic cation transporter protein-like [Nicrophorus vespilloides]|uniref:Organic cation transporter protein-like n=1 Tax=Nicrophorus vespilloides TaxID=110193 RepID=A0ABM1NKF9_NICVS|nr:PREDICTED: organic cation transporter protein-like [Nicrophorus vespilloides]